MSEVALNDIQYGGPDGEVIFIKKDSPDVSQLPEDILEQLRENGSVGEAPKPVTDAINAANEEVAAAKAETSRLADQVAELQAKLKAAQDAQIIPPKP